LLVVLEHQNNLLRFFIALAAADPEHPVYWSDFGSSFFF
jgi:hypothetical protein